MLWNEEHDVPRPPQTAEESRGQNLPQPGAVGLNSTKYSSSFETYARALSSKLMLLPSKQSPWEATYLLEQC